MSDRFIYVYVVDGDYSLEESLLSFTECVFTMLLDDYVFTELNRSFNKRKTVSLRFAYNYKSLHSTYLCEIKSHLNSIQDN